MISTQQARTVQGSGIYLMFRATKLDGSPINPASVDYVRVHSQCVTAPASIGNQTYDNTHVYSSYQTDNKWQEDRKGYNVGLPVPSTLIPNGGQSSQLDTRITYTDGTTDQLRPVIVYVERVYS